MLSSSRLIKTFEIILKTRRSNNGFFQVDRVLLTRYFQSSSSTNIQNDQLANNHPSTISSSSVNDDASSSFSWKRVGVPSHILGKLDVMKGLTIPTPVQQVALPYLLGDLTAPPGDCLIHSETGSGKTLAYLLPIFSRLDAKTAPIAKLRAIIVTPTRELSLQVASVAEKLAAVGNKKDPSRTVRVVRVVGEISAQMLHELKESPPHVLIGTPATLANLIGVHINTGELQTLVLDEADELLRNHSIAHVKALVSSVRKHGNKPGTIAVSATSSFGLVQFVNENMKKSHKVVDLTRGSMITPSTLSHYFVRLGKANAMYNSFTRFLAAARPSCALSFHNSSKSMEALEAHLRNNHIPVGLLGNAYANAQRARALEGVRSGKLHVLLSTEMAARGLDLPRISHVVNFDPPTSLREYIHRAGRAGRLSSLSVNRAGVVVSFITTDSEQEALIDFAHELGVALGEMTFEGGEIKITSLIGPVGNGEERKKHEAKLRNSLRMKASSGQAKVSETSAVAALLLVQETIVSEAI